MTTAGTQASDDRPESIVFRRVANRKRELVLGLTIAVAIVDLIVLSFGLSRAWLVGGMVLVSIAALTVAAYRAPSSPRSGSH
jgi:hypothetical protein